MTQSPGRDVAHYGIAAGGPCAMESLWGHRASRHLCGPRPRMPPFPGNESHAGYRALSSPTSGPDFRTPRSPWCQPFPETQHRAGNTYMVPPQIPELKTPRLDTCRESHGFPQPPSRGSRQVRKGLRSDIGTEGCVSPILTGTSFPANHAGRQREDQHLGV